MGWDVALGLLAGVVGLVGLAVLAPVRSTVGIQLDDDLRWRFRVVGLFGLVRIGRSGALAAAKDGAAAPPPPIRRRRSGGRRRPGVPTGPLIRFAKTAVRRVRLGDGRIDLRIGLDDPADTGMLMAVAMPAVAVLGAGDRLRASIEPDFEGPRLEGYAHITARIMPAALLGPAARLAWDLRGSASRNRPQ